MYSTYDKRLGILWKLITYANIWDYFMQWFLWKYSIYSSQCQIWAGKLRQKEFLLFNFFTNMELLSGLLSFSKFPQHIPMCPVWLLTISLLLLAVLACYPVIGPAPDCLRPGPISRIETVGDLEVVQHFLSSTRVTINEKYWKKSLFETSENNLQPY